MRQIHSLRDNLLRRLRPQARRKGKGRLAGAPPVVVLHGLQVPRLVMAPLAWRLEHYYGRRVFNIPFNTWTHDLPECALLISDHLQRLNLRDFDAVTHSTGGLLLRWAVNHCPMPRLRRAVMVAPPNGGAWIADYLHRRMGPFYPLVYGQSGLQLRRDERGIAPLARRLEGSEVGIIAGGSGTSRGKRNLLGIPGDNDGTIAVEETILPGMQDFILLNLDHTRLMLSSQTAHMANLFLEHGVFRPRPATAEPAH